MDELRAIYDYLTKTAGVSVGDAWQAVNIVSSDDADDESRCVR